MQIGLFDSSRFIQLKSYLTESESRRIALVQRQWDFYEGYHWQDIADTQDRPRVTENYCAAYVNKFVAFELGKGFSINTQTDLKDKPVTEGGLTVIEYLDRVWQDNRRNELLYELGQAKGVNGDCWVQVRFESPDQLHDIFGEYSKGRIRIVVYHKGLVFPTYDPHDKEKLTSIKIMYEIDIETKKPWSDTSHKETVVYKQVWTNEKIYEYYGNDKISEQDNPYNLIPFVQIKNFPLVGRNEGISDLENLIPLNTEYNMKQSDISEIIDYHASPVTVITGAKVGNLERGANKVWGLPKDAKAENLELKSDLGASNKYCDGLKKAMNEVGGVPVGALGGEQAISNTSGVALQFVNAPIIERTNIKKEATSYGIKQINKLILYLSLLNKIITIPEGISTSDFYNTTVEIPDTTPKDLLVELQRIEIEMRLGLEDRKGAMVRLGHEDIDARLAEIDKDREANPLIYGIQEQNTEDGDGKTGMGGTRQRPTDTLGNNKEGQLSKVNSGMTNGDK